MGLNLNNVLIGSANPDALVTFYTLVLGNPTWQAGGWVAWQVGASYLTVGPDNDVDGRSEQPRRMVIGFQIEDVQGEFNRIREIGAEVVQAPFHPVDGPDDWLAVLADTPTGTSSISGHPGHREPSGRSNEHHAAV